MATNNKIRYLLRTLLMTSVLVLVPSQCVYSKPIQDEGIFVLQEVGSPVRRSVVIVITKRNEKVIACETRIDDSPSLTGDYTVKSLTGKEFNNALKDCATFPKSRQRRQAPRIQPARATNCTGAGCNESKNCTGVACNESRNCTSASCNNKSCTGTGCINNKNCTGSGCNNKNCTSNDCIDRNTRGAEYNTGNCSGAGCDAHDDDCTDDTCDEAPNDESAGDDEMWNIIFPGTKWCGSGSLGRSFDDLGMLKETDKCCRSHDNCNDTMAGGETKHNLTNTSSFTKLNCACDDEFYDCLKNENSMISHTIGRTYFNILRRTCYTQDYPDSKECKTYLSFLKITCKEYAKDTSVPKVYMWKSPKRYRKLPIPIIG